MPAFQPGMHYNYSIALGSSADVFNLQTNVDDPKLDGFDATATVFLNIYTEPLDQSPEPGTLIFNAQIQVPSCNVQQGSSSPGREGTFVRSPGAVTQACGLPAMDGPEPIVYVTQNLSSGEFCNVYWNQSVTAAWPGNEQDPAGFTKLVVSALRTLQAHYSPQEIFSVERPSRFGRLRNITYNYIGTISNSDDPCWQAEAESVNRDQYEYFQKQICWSSQGGVSHATTGDSAVVGSLDTPANLPLMSSILADFSIVMSQDNSATMYYDTQRLYNPGLGTVNDIGAGYLGSDLSTYIFTVDAQGVLVRWTLNGYVPTEKAIGNIQPTPFVTYAGISLPEMAAEVKHVWAVGARGAICSYNENSTSYIPLDPSEAYTDWKALDLGIGVRHVEPFHFPQGFRLPDGSILAEPEDGVLVVLANSSIISIPVTAANPFGQPRLVMNNKEIGRSALLGAAEVSLHIWYCQRYLPVCTNPDEVSYNPAIAAGAQPQRHAIVTPFDHAPLASLVFTGNNQWQPVGHPEMNDMTHMVNRLFLSLDDAGPLLEFRRAFASCNAPSINNLWLAIDTAHIMVANGENASALFSTIYDYPVSESIASHMSDIMLGNVANADSGPVRLTAVSQSPGLPCLPRIVGDALHSLSSANSTADGFLADAATNALAAFVGSPPCSFDPPNYEPPHSRVVNGLLEKSSKATNNEELLKTVYALANSRHPDVIDVARDLLNHTSSPMRVGAIRAIANVPSHRATTHLVHHILHNRDPHVRSFGMSALKHHQAEDSSYATRQILTALFRPFVKRLTTDLNGFAAFFQDRIAVGEADRHLARIGIGRVRVIQHAINATDASYGNSIFPPIIWGKELTGLNAKAMVSLVIDSNFDADGADLHTEAGIGGEIFETKFDIASAGIYAASNSRGVMSLTAWMAVFLLDVTTMRQVPYYVIAVQYQAATVFQLSQGDPCQLTVPASLARTIRETRSFISATYYYGIPLIANVNLQVELIGYYELGYGIQLKTQQTPAQPIPGQIGAFLRPAAGIFGQISANVQVLVVSGGVRGSLNFATLSLPVGGGVEVNSLSPFEVGFGDSAQFQGDFLQGSCGGSCDSQSVYNLFSWGGIAMPPAIIDDRSSICESLVDVSHVAPSPSNREAALQQAIEAPLPENVGIAANPDSPDYCDCQVVPYNLRDAFVDYTPYFSTSGWSRTSLMPLHINSMWPSPLVNGVMLKFSLSGLDVVMGMDRDEVPMNKARRGVWQGPLPANCPGGCGQNWPHYLLDGTPRLTDGRLAMYHEDAAHPNLRYEVGDNVRIEFEPPAGQNHRVVYSRLENFTVASAHLLRTGSETSNLTSGILNAPLSVGGKATLYLRLASDLLENAMAVPDSGGGNDTWREAPVVAEFSHLVMHRLKPNLVWLAHSTAYVTPRIRRDIALLRHPLTAVPRDAILLIIRTLEQSYAALSMREYFFLGVIAALSVWFLVQRQRLTVTTPKIAKKRTRHDDKSTNTNWSNGEGTA
ncbi:hypothetical protein DL766_010502 [Monosporascus sp. MC13-8B]|nr:hypothetical protein DL763_001015 [Monosporascus cannonballus]RYP02097.1 hypothetical protein DL766_010502 [Monosporascus sp. MC13-8B]